MAGTCEAMLGDIALVVTLPFIILLPVMMRTMSAVAMMIMMMKSELDSNDTCGHCSMIYSEPKSLYTRSASQLASFG